MGLDSVEILMNFEKRFDIEISDLEAEKIRTVQQMADVIYDSLKLKHPNRIKVDNSVFDLVYERLVFGLTELGILKEQITVEAKYINFFGLDDIHYYWAELENKIDLKLPIISNPPINKNSKNRFKIFGFNVKPKNETLKSLKMNRLTDCVVSLNHKKLIKNTYSKYTIERVICGIIEEILGVPILEIEMHHSFVNDFGID